MHMPILVTVDETHWEGRVSKNVGKGLGVCFILWRRLNF